MIYAIIFIAIFALPMLWIVSIYNRIQRKKLATAEGWSDIGTALQQRNDLIPNLVETVKGYVKHEGNTLTEVTRLRNLSASALDHSEQNITEVALRKAMVNVFAIAENYPNLKADVQFQKLQGELSGIEEKISNSRKSYNAAVRNFNSELAVFPNNMVASFFNVAPSDFFIEDEVSRKAPKVSF